MVLKESHICTQTIKHKERHKVQDSDALWGEKFNREGTNKGLKESPILWAGWQTHRHLSFCYSLNSACIFYIQKGTYNITAKRRGRGHKDDRGSRETETGGGKGKNKKEIPREVLSYEKPIVFWFLPATLNARKQWTDAFKTEILNLQFYTQPYDIYPLRTKWQIQTSHKSKTLIFPDTLSENELSVQIQKNTKNKTKQMNTAS